MARSRPVKIKPAEDLNGLVIHYPASAVTALDRSADLIRAVDRATVFLVGDIDPVVIPRRLLEELTVFGERLAGALEPFTVADEEEAPTS